MQVQKTTELGKLNQYCGIGAVMAVGVIGGLGYYIYQVKKGGLQGPASGEALVPVCQQPRPQNNKFEMDYIYSKPYKMDKKSIVNDLCQAAVISVFAVGYSMLGKKILRMAPTSIQKFDLEDTGKLVVIIAASAMMREYLIKQKILPDYINV